MSQVKNITEGPKSQESVFRRYESLALSTALHYLEKKVSIASISNDITQADIKEAAVQCAKREGWNVEPQDCAIKEIHLHIAGRDGSRSLGNIALPCLSQDGAYTSHPLSLRYLSDVRK